MKKILFFDDDSFITKWLINNLKENYGWNKANETEIIFCAELDQLLVEINDKNKQYDLFVLDIMSPEPSGDLRNAFTEEELLRMNGGMSTGIVMKDKIRQQERYKNVPILYLSARLVPAQYLDKITIHIRKPESAEVISQTMSELLKTN